MAQKRNRLVILLGIALAVVVVGSAAALYLVPDQPDPLIADIPTDTTNTTTPVGTTTGANSGFNLQVLERQAYQQLNKQLIREGALPVSPPAVVGKANPFL